MWILASMLPSWLDRKLQSEDGLENQQNPKPACKIEFLTYAHKHELHVN